VHVGVVDVGGVVNLGVGVYVFVDYFNARLFWLQHVCTLGHAVSYGMCATCHVHYSMYVATACRGTGCIYGM
jgi:hypothetical protein